MSTIYRRELKSYFDSMIGYLIIAFLVFFLGIYFLAYNLSGGYPYFSAALSGMTVMMLIAIPILTMRSFSEERKNKTDQLLFTSPVSIWGIVWGKYLSMVTVFAIPTALFCICPLIIQANGTAYLAADYGSLLAFFLMGCVFIAVGMWISSLTESLVTAAVGTFGCLLLLLLWPSLVGFLPESAFGSLVGFWVIWSMAVFAFYRITESQAAASALEAAGTVVLVLLYLWNRNMFEYALVHALEAVAVEEVFERFVLEQTFDLGGLLFYLSLIGLFLFLTCQSLERRRWS